MRVADPVDLVIRVAKSELGLERLEAVAVERPFFVLWDGCGGLFVFRGRRRVAEEFGPPLSRDAARREAIELLRRRNPRRLVA